MLLSVLFKTSETSRRYFADKYAKGKEQEATGKDVSTANTQGKEAAAGKGDEI